ncbi:tyrosine-type recombinase/integrase [Croceicoccus ponticola]|uniref:tyrosine-type recombinase/integrase n=1 Tax=Croceicoccus ponticola TaxID=2217664 RepID=UPI0013E3368A|nr:tyrosine-type recombinase/integrase [Croceicoccus ponticola]
MKVSLRVSDMNSPGAMDSYQAIEREYEDIVRAARKLATGTYDRLDEPMIAFLAEKYRVQELKDDEDRRWDPKAKARGEMVTTAAEGAGYSFSNANPSARWSQGVRLAIEAALDVYRSFRANGDLEGLVDAWSEHAFSLASDAGYIIAVDDPFLAKLCKALNDAAIAAHEAQLLRFEGGAFPTPPAPEPTKMARGSALKQIGIMDLYERYAAQPDRHPKTMAQWRPYIRRLAEFIGDDNVLAIEHDDIVAWRNHLRDEATYRGKRLSAKTINGSYLGAASALFAWAKGDGLIPRNPMLEVTKVKLPAKAVTRSKAFTTEEAHMILRASLEPSVSPEGVHLRNAKRWCTWLMAYSGARVNEITQLRKEDIFVKDGVNVMRITPDAGTVKSKALRVVPLHSHLIEQDFLEFVASRPEGPLFYDPAKRRSDHAINRQSNRLGSKLAAWVRSLGIDGVKPNHAWRHLFISQASRHQIDPRVTRAITGHSLSDAHSEYDHVNEHADVLSRELEKMPRFLELTTV